MLKISGANRPDEWMKRQCKTCIYESICNKDQHNHKGHCQSYRRTSLKKLMNKIDEMWSICHDCPYWEVCDPPYICEATEQKIKGEKVWKIRN